MPLMIECPSCKWKGRAPDAALGKKVRCPSCKGEFMAEAPPSAPPSAPPPGDDLEVVEDEAVADMKEAVTDKADSNHRQDDEDRPKKKRRDRDDEDEDEEDDDRPRKKRRDYEDDEEDEDRPQKKKRRYHDEETDDKDEDDEDDDRPKKKRSRDDEDDEDDEDDRPKKKRRDRDDDEDDDDRPRKKKKRGRDDDDDDDDRPKLSKKGRQKLELQRLRLGTFLNFIAAPLMIGAFGLTLLLIVIGWAADWGPDHGIMALAAIVAWGSWIVAGVGFVFGLLGPKSNNAFGLGIATISVAGAHLLLSLCSFGMGYGGENGSGVWWMAAVTNVPIFMGLVSDFTGKSVLPLLASLTEPARLILYALTLKAYAEGLRKYDTVNKAKPLVIGVGAIYGGLMIINLVFGIIMHSMVKSALEERNFDKAMKLGKTLNTMLHLDVIVTLGVLTGMAVWFFFLVKEAKDDF